MAAGRANLIDSSPQAMGSPSSLARRLFVPSPTMISNDPIQKRNRRSSSDVSECLHTGAQAAGAGDRAHLD